MENLLEQLAGRGIVAAPAEIAQTWLDAREAELSKTSETEPQETNVGLTVEIPLDKVAVGNLTKLLDAKGNLIRKALGITDLRIELLEDRVAFPWFSQGECGLRSRLHPFHFRTLRDEQECQAGDGDRETSGE